MGEENKGKVKEAVSELVEDVKDEFSRDPKLGWKLILRFTVAAALLVGLWIFWCYTALSYYMEGPDGGSKFDIVEAHPFGKAVEADNFEDVETDRWVVFVDGIGEVFYDTDDELVPGSTIHVEIDRKAIEEMQEQLTELVVPATWHTDGVFNELKSFWRITKQGYANMMQ